MGVDCHALLQVILPVRGPNPCLLYFLQWQVSYLPLALPDLPSILFLFHALWVSAISCKYVYNAWKRESVSCSVVSNSDPMYYSPPGSSVHGILQVRIKKWVAISFSIEGLNLGLLHCRQILYHQSYHGSPYNAYF